MESLGAAWNAKEDSNLVDMHGVVCCTASWAVVPLGLLPMVLIFFIAFNRTFLSSCFSSSMSTAMGYKSVSFSFAVAIVRCAACGDQEMYCVGEKVFGQDNVAAQSCMW